MKLFVPLLLAAAMAAGCGGDDNPNGPTPPRGEYSATDLVVGTGTEATNGRSVTVNYALWFYNPSGTDGKGQQIPQNPGVFTFVLGTRSVIEGWDRGILGMRVGGRRRLVIPPELAYGAQGNQTIPPNTTLVFDVELANVQ